MNSGKIVRSAVSEVSLTGRNTQGVMFARPDANDRVAAIARNVETAEEIAPESGDSASEAADSEQAGDQGVVNTPDDMQAEVSGDVASTVDNTTDEDES